MAEPKAPAVSIHIQDPNDAQVSHDTHAGNSVSSCEVQSQAEQNSLTPEQGSGIHQISAISLDTETDDQDGTVSEVDSAIGSWRSSRTQSLTSSVLDYRYENGRRYHAYREGSYHLPNDENEQERLDLQHRIYRIALNNHLYLCPIPNGEIHNILDVGCGTGSWCIDVADELPHAQVLGFDLSPIQPNMVPPNCKFLVDDCNSEWVFDTKFDIIHTRAMTPGIKNWPRFIQQASDQLKPGGYIELQEVSMPIFSKEKADDNSPVLVQWSNYVVEAGNKAGLDLSAPTKLGEMLQAQGFTNINIQWQNWPIGPWARGAKNKEIGRWWAEDLQDGCRNAAALFTRVLGWTPEEFEEFVTKAVNEIRTMEKHMWCKVCFAYAQKPAK